MRETKNRIVIVWRATAFDWFTHTSHRNLHKASNIKVKNLGTKNNGKKKKTLFKRKRICIFVYVALFVDLLWVSCRIGRSQRQTMNKLFFFFFRNDQWRRVTTFSPICLNESQWKLTTHFTHRYLPMPLPLPLSFIFFGKYQMFRSNKRQNNSRSYKLTYGYTE